MAESNIDVEALPEIAPYAVLDLEPDATQEEIKRAYRKAALKNHPDKAAAEDKVEAHTRFQEIAFAYAILSDERRRKRYDTTGSTEEILENDEDFNWVDFYREQFANIVTTEAIDTFSKQYKGGDEERRHLLAAYKKHQGSMGAIYSSVMLSDVLEDEERFRGIIDEAIKSGEVEGFSKYTNESEKSKKARITQAQKRRDQEGKEAEKAAKEIQETGKSKAKGKKKPNGDLGDLAALIQQRQQGRADNFFDALEAKYAPTGKKGKAGSKRSMEEPPEEAFARNAKKGKGGAK
ncbi:DnaJ domain-containing protein [Neohortaea acidophila]|uniref:DnaJ domain-containing protein n=1 Tax=Neohortaea acidophila TaxID=245834 RepID=A0A6A6PGV6_9PEZI|nr:DnaJ domain-containing protein [Neohortaea acidophila]KAF2478527.1 DnaJ domain-containing protein [Neohortaea acidophila]